MTEPGVPFLTLGDPAINREQFGAKAHVLSTLMASKEVRVPSGYALDLHRMKLDGPDLTDALKEIHHELRPDGRQLIVRSSALLEDVGRSLFPGRFASRRNLKSVADLEEGVRYCVEHSADIRVSDYRQAHRLGPVSPISSVIIQEQISASFAGVAFTLPPKPYHRHSALIEFIKGDATNLLAGSDLGVLVGFDPEPEKETYIQLAGPQYKLSELAELLNEVLSVARAVEQILGEPQDIEWVWSDEMLYVVQARPIRPLLPPQQTQKPERRRSQSKRKRKKLSLHLSPKYGQKAASELYFQKRECGAPHGILIPPNADSDEIDALLEEAHWHARKDGTVLRYSYKEEAGLTVQFVSKGDDIAGAFLAGRALPEYAGIISDYVFVEHAFEAYLDADSLIVEHIPGNWEPPNVLPPDVLIWQGNDVSAWRHKGVRRATFELPSHLGTPSTLQRDVPPTDPKQMLRWIAELPPVFEKLREDFPESLPLNVHFVRAKGRWHFLNIRPTHDLTVKRTARTPRAEFKPKRLFLVRSPQDVAEWDQAAPILVTFRADSPHDSQLATLGAQLRSSGVGSVFATFGVLSHPALVLREFGLEVVPLYDTSELIRP